MGAARATAVGGGIVGGGVFASDERGALAGLHRHQTLLLSLAGAGIAKALGERVVVDL